MRHAIAILLPALCHSDTALAAAPEHLSSGHAAQVLGGLAIVLALIALASWAARRMQSLRPNAGRHIRVVEGLAIGTRDKLLLVEVDGQRILIGVSPGRMTTLGTVPAGATPSFADALANNPAPSAA